MRPVAEIVELGALASEAERAARRSTKRAIEESVSKPHSISEAQTPRNTEKFREENGSIAKPHVRNRDRK
jgi:hypothetical protein